MDMKINKLATMASASAVLALLPAQPAAADDALIAALGFGAGLITSNTTSLGDNAGELESWSVAAQIADTAADKLWARLEDKAAKLNVDAADKSTVSVLLLGTSQAFDPTAYATVTARNNWLTQLFTAAEASCHAAAGAATKDATFTSPSAIVPAVLGVIKSETTINDKIIAPPEAFWLNAVAARKGARTIITPASLLPDPESAVATNWLALVNRSTRQDAVNCAQAKHGAAPRMKDLIAEIAATDAGFRKADPGKMSLLEQASALDGLGLATAGLLVLRTSQQKVGGTIIQSKNIFTAFGAPAVRIGGGMVITWELSKIETGGKKSTVLAAGNLACTAPMRRLGTVNSTALSKDSLEKSCQISQPAQAGS
jgi:hypothetical protein